MKVTRKSENDRLIKSGLIITIPAAVILFSLMVLDEINSQVAISAYIAILILTWIFILPFMTDFISITNYLKSLAKGNKDVLSPQIDNNNPDVKDMVESINAIMNIWSSENANLKAQTMTDAAILAVLPYPLMMIARDMRICGANLVALDIFGHNIKGKNADKVFNDKNLLSLIKQAVTGKLKQTIVCKIQTKKERYFHITVENLPVEAKDGAVAVVAFHDITSIKKNEIMQADFIANASHELKTPLAVISGFIETLQTSAKGDVKATAEFLSIMDIQAKRMSRLIGDLLCLSRLEAKEMVKTETIDIKKLVEATFKALANKAKSRNITFEMKLDDDYSPIGSQDEMAQVLQNLVDNAIKYGAENSPITVLTRTDGDNHVITVKNYGNPIPSEHLSRLCERFYRVDSSAKAKAEGTGLGLSIVKSILKRHGAKLWVTSSAEDGTEFNIIFSPPQL